MVAAVANANTAFFMSETFPVRGTSTGGSGDSFPRAPFFWTGCRSASLSIFDFMVAYPNMTLVHIFGSTPILTRNYQSATYLAEFCFENGPPAGLGWVDECPDDIKGAIELAEKRRIDEALASCGFLSRSAFSWFESYQAASASL
jgi:hypothetical protein